MKYLFILFCICIHCVKLHSSMVFFFLFAKDSGHVLTVVKGPSLTSDSLWLQLAQTEFKNNTEDKEKNFKGNVETKQSKYESLFPFHFFLFPFQRQAWCNLVTPNIKWPKTSLVNSCVKDVWQKWNAIKGAKCLTGFYFMTLSLTILSVCWKARCLLRLPGLTVAYHIKAVLVYWWCVLAAVDMPWTSSLKFHYSVFLFCKYESFLGLKLLYVWNVL